MARAIYETTRRGFLKGGASSAIGLAAVGIPAPAPAEEEKGDGVLTINAENEGLDSELHLTINGGNININSLIFFGIADATKEATSPP